MSSLQKGENRRMIASTHLAAGAVSGALAENYLSENVFLLRASVGFSLGLLSHLILDSVPHSEEWLYKWGLFPILIVEVIVTLLVIFVITGNYFFSPGLISGIMGAATPDMARILTKYFSLSWKALSFLSWLNSAVHDKSAISAMATILAQISILTIALIVLLKLAKPS